MDRKSAQITALINQSLERNEFRVGDKLPTEAELGARYKCSRTTVREGLAYLVQKGILERRRGSGTFLASVVPVTPKTRIIGTIFPSISIFGHPGVYAEILQGIENAAHKKGFSLMIGNMDNDQEKAKLHVTRFLENNVAGIIYSPMIVPDYEHKNAEILEEIERNNIPVVVVNSMIGKDWGGRFSFVGSNHFSAMVEVVKHVVTLGHRHIAFIRCFEGVSSADQQFAGFVYQIRAEKLEYRDEYIKSVKFGTLEDVVQNQGSDEIKQLFALKEPPTAVICTNDYVAKNVINEVKRIGMNVPEDLTVIGFDDRQFSLYLDPPLTTVRQPLYDEGRLAFDILYQKLKNEKTGNNQSFLDCSLVLRQSSGVCKGATVNEQVLSDLKQAQQQVAVNS